MYWPGGGGELEDEKLPGTRDGYYIVGSWCKWAAPKLMKKNKDGDLSAVIVLGENRFERFQIWCDGKPDTALYPDRLNAPIGSKVLGPGLEEGMLEEDKESLEDVLGGRAPCWMIDGRATQYVATSRPAIGDASGVLATTVTSTEVEEVGTDETGMPGDEYEITLSVNGKWRMVSWKKVSDGSSKAPFPAGTYSVAAAWNGWQLEEMTCTGPGVYTLDCPMYGYTNEFSIVRDEDWSQVFYPPESGGPPFDTFSGTAAGPDGWDTAYGEYFRIGARAGDTAHITLKRLETGGVEVSWTLTKFK